MNIPKNSFYVLLIFVWIFQSCNSNEYNLKLSEDLRELLEAVEGEFAVAYLNLENRDTILIHEHENFHAASTMKTPVMIEAFKHIKENNLKLIDSVQVYNRFYSIVDSSEYSLSPENDGDSELYHLIDQKVTWNYLINRMITKSSNLATNILIDLLKGHHVTRTMRELGATNIQVLRGVEDIKAYEAGLSNTTTAYDLLMIYDKLARYQIVDSASSQTMIDILLDQEYNSLIPASLPKHVKIAHKTGSITGIHHDSGIVILPDDRKYVLVLLSKNISDRVKADKCLVDVSRMIYEYFLRTTSRDK